MDHTGLIGRFLGRLGTMLVFEINHLLFFSGVKKILMSVKERSVKMVALVSMYLVHFYAIVLLALWASTVD